MVEHPRRRVLLLPVELVEGVLDVIADDRLGAAQRAQRREPERVRPLFALGRPDPFHHELEIRRLDPPLAPAAVDGADARLPEFDAARRHLVEHRLDELRLDRHGFPRELVPPRDGPEDRGPRGVAVEPVESELVCEHVRQRRLEDVQRTERVFAQRDQDVHARLGTQQLRQGLDQRPAARAVIVVDEVLLELVEDHVRLGHVLHLGERGGGVLRPRVVHDDERRRRDLAQLADDACAEDRRLADAGLAVEHGQPRREQVRDDHRALALPSEEEERVEVGVVENAEPLVRARRNDELDVHADASAAPIPA